MSTLRIRLRQGVVEFAIAHAGWPLPVAFLERVRDFANHALGAGSASLATDQSGESRLLDHLADSSGNRTHTVVLDVGAHTGGYAAAARTAFGDRARIHCFEPNPVTFSALLANAPYATCHPLGLGATAGRASLFSDGGRSPLASLYAHTFGGAKKQATERYDVEVDTLDRVADRLGLTQIDLLKVDVEGHELAVLQGAKRLLEAGQISAIQFEFGERNLASRTYLRDFFDLLGDTYDLFRVTPRGLRRLEYRSSHEVFLHEANYAALRRSTEARSSERARDHG